MSWRTVSTSSYSKESDVKTFFYAVGFFFIANGVRAIRRPPDSKVQYFVDVAGIPLGATIIYRNYVNN